MGKLYGSINNFPSVRFLKRTDGKLSKRKTDYLDWFDALVKVDISLGFVIYALNIPLVFVRIVMIFPLGFIKNCYICR